MKIVTEGLHCDKGSISYNGEQQGLTDDQISKVIGALYEVIFTIDADTGKILTVNGKTQ